MGRTRTAGLIQRGGIWHIDKRLRGRRIRESTGESDLAKAQEYLIRRLEEARQASVFGVRPNRSFLQAATKYLEENRERGRALGGAESGSAGRGRQSRTDYLPLPALPRHCHAFATYAAAQSFASSD